MSLSSSAIMWLRRSANKGRRTREDEIRKEERLQKRQRRQGLMNYHALFTSARKEFEDAWALRNIVSATSEHTGHAAVLIVKLVASPSAIVRQHMREILPMLEWLIKLNSDNVLRETCWVLSCLIDGIFQALNDGLCPHLLNVLGHRRCMDLIPGLPVDKIFAGADIPTQSLIDADIIWSLLRLMKDSNSQLLEKQVLPFLKEILISSTDKDVLRVACWVLSYISDDIDDIQAILDADVCQHLVKLLGDSSDCVLYPALRTVSNIFAGCRVTNIFPGYNDKKIQSLIDADIICTLIGLMKDNISHRLENRLLLFLKEILISSTDEDVLRVACTALSYFSDDLYIIDAILDAGVCRRLVYHLCDSSDCVLYPALRTVSNIFFGYDNEIQSVIDDDIISILVGLMKDNISHRLENRLLLFLKEILISSTDEDVLRVACTALSYFSDDLYIIDAILDAGVCRRLVYLLRDSSDCVLYPALRTVSNIFFGYDNEIQIMIDEKALPVLFNILTEGRWEFIKLQACAAILKITHPYHHHRHTKSVIDAGIIAPLIHILENAALNNRTRVQAARAFFYMTYGESNGHIDSLVKQGCMKAMCNTLSCSYRVMVGLCLQGLENILKVGESQKRSGSENGYVEVMNGFKGFEEIRKLKDIDSEGISKRAARILETYFCQVKDSQQASQFN